MSKKIALSSFRLLDFLILLLAAWLRFYYLSGQSLWSDEGNSVALARRSFSEIAQRTAFDIHPPLYYWLLRIWTLIFGDSEIGLRSLSAVLGLGVVYLTGLLGRRLFGKRMGLMAAFIAALSPLQVYYSQEARMYMLLTALSSLTVLLTWSVVKGPEGREGSHRSLRLTTPAGWLYLLTVTAGLYTHYAYPLILLVVNLSVLFWFWPDLKSPILSNKSLVVNGKSPIVNWLLLQLIPLLLYLPWLPTAWRQLTTWPAERQSVSFLTALETVATTLLWGLSWPYNLAFLAVIVIGIALLLTFSFRRSNCNVLLLWLWFLLPVALTLVVFSPAFLKFLLVAAPALALLLALAVDIITSLLTFRTSRSTSYLVGGILLAILTLASSLSLYHYYTNPVFARDNYRAIADFIKAVARPDDAVILHAEGQQDVFNYYYAGSQTPLYPLPRRRPLDEAATLAELQAITNQSKRVYAVYWATHQADPQGVIESWLDTHLLKATDQWYGNVRLVSYANPQVIARTPRTPVDYRLGPHLRLTGYAFSSASITPGDILPVALTWQTDTPLPPGENYTVFIQVLDAANHLVGQRDASLPSPPAEWPANRPVADGYGLLIEPGTPPGPHRLIVGLYNSATGQRLPVAEGGDFVELGLVEVTLSARPLPREAFKIQVALNEPMLGVDLLGYDLYKLGHRSTPETPLHPGDPVELVAYWQTRRQAQQLEDQLLIRVVKLSGEETPISMTYPLAGVNYPRSQWPSGQIIRAQYNFFLDNLPVGNYRLALTLPTGQNSTQSATVFTRPFQVEH